MGNKPLDFPAPPPETGWPQEVIHLLVGIGVLDMLNAIAAVFFVYAYFRKKDWSFWLGNLTLTVSVYGFFLYVYWTYASGAWSDSNLAAYVFVLISFLPILLLWLFYGIWGIQNRLSYSAEEVDSRTSG